MPNHVYCSVHYMRLILHFVNTSFWFQNTLFFVQDIEKVKETLQEKIQVETTGGSSTYESFVVMFMHSKQQNCF